MLKLVSEQSKPNGGTSEAIEILSDAHREISNLLREMPTTSMPEIKKAGLIGALRKLINEELGQAFEEVRWDATPEVERYIQEISPLTAEVLYYATREAIRNAAKHGRQPYQEAPLHLYLNFIHEKDLIIQIEDDGKGFGGEQIMQESNGHGLALHSTMMAVIGGELTIESEQGKFTKVTLTLP
jgi:signal transduction histidine kinase